MQRVLFLVFISLLISNVICQDLSQNYGFEFVGRLNKTAITCLRNSNPSISFILVRIYKISVIRGIDQGGAQTLDILNRNPDLLLRGFGAYAQVCRGDSPNAIATALYQAYYPLGPPFDNIFLKLQQNTVAGCTWKAYNNDNNCNFLRQVVASLNLVSGGRATIGYYSTPTAWKFLFGNKCNDLSAGSLLWYANYDSTGRLNSALSFNDYVPFGGWANPLFKTISNSVNITLCNNPAWRAVGSMVLIIQ